MEEFGRRFPSLKKVLIDDRNSHMAGMIRKIAGECGEVVAVIGDGHVEGLMSLISDLPVKVIRLKDLRDTRDIGEDPSVSQNGNGQATFSFNYR